MNDRDPCLCKHARLYHLVNDTCAHVSEDTNEACSCVKFVQHRKTFTPPIVNVPEWWYLSFVRGEEGFVGACIVKADHLGMAVLAAHDLNCNPGGEVLGFEIPKQHIPDLIYMNRLLTKEEVSAFWPDSMSLGDCLDKHVAN